MAINSESVPPISVDLDPEFEKEEQGEREAEKLISRTRKIRDIIGNSRRRILGRFKGNPFTLEINPMNQFAINHYDKETRTSTHIRISRSGEIVASGAIRDSITNKVPVTIDPDELLDNYVPREKAK